MELGVRFAQDRRAAGAVSWRDHGYARAGDSLRHTMDRMTKDLRALELFELAQSVLDAKSHFVSVGVLTYKEYRQGS